MEFKNKIYYENFILPEMQKLIYAGKVLDDYKNLKESKVGHWAKIHLFYTKEHTNIQIDFFFIQTQSGKIINIYYNPNDTIKDIKEKVLELQCIPLKNQKLIFEEKNLEDTKTLSYYNIKNI